MKNINEIMKNFKSGKELKIHKKNFMETCFKYENKKVLYKNDYITNSVYLEHIQDLKGIKKHFENMLKQNFEIDLI